MTPDNIYITKDGQVKLLDFGSARYSIGDKSKSLDVILKVGYAPKEQYIRRSRQGPFTDVYSCAACFYAAITGFLPPESLERMDEDTLVPISQTGIEIPEYLDKAILKGLAVQPEDRFQNAAEFLEAIENQQVVEVPAPAERQLLRPRRRKRSSPPSSPASPPWSWWPWASASPSAAEAERPLLTQTVKRSSWWRQRYPPSPFVGRYTVRILQNYPWMNWC